MRQLLQAPEQLRPVIQGKAPQYVWLRAPPRGASLAPKFTGPHKVVSIRWPNLTLDVNGKSYVTNVDRTAPAFHTRHTASHHSGDTLCDDPNKGIIRYTQEELATMQPIIRLEQHKDVEPVHRESRYGRILVPFNRLV